MNTLHICTTILLLTPVLHRLTHVSMKGNNITHNFTTKKSLSSIFFPSDSLSLCFSSLNVTFYLADKSRPTAPGGLLDVIALSAASTRHVEFPLAISLTLGIYKRSVNKLTYCYTFTQLMSKKRFLKYSESRMSVAERSLFYPEDAGNTFFRNVGNSPSE